jgi:hypothetical protein
VAKIPCVLFDLDGTLANVVHRLHHIKTEGSPNWPAFFDACIADTPNDYVITLNHMCYQAVPAVFICSGRPDSHLDVTTQWLKKHYVRYHKLFMRPAGDYRPDTEIKKEMLEIIRGLDFDPLFAVDDRPSVVAMWRANNVPCFVVDDKEWHS